MLQSLVQFQLASPAATTRESASKRLDLPQDDSDVQKGLTPSSAASPHQPLANGETTDSKLVELGYTHRVDNTKLDALA